MRRLYSLVSNPATVATWVSEPIIGGINLVHFNIFQIQKK
ncbi:hypothetical protein D1AOALGA4SA_10652 [Olavius algarvensis Delta 1 endosymbiont]|nr:hypothetical protein D1AOALGA4SA_10652 [Olavius algarvensis Delta 1 endosymbiont]